METAVRIVGLVLRGFDISVSVENRMAYKWASNDFYAFGC